MKRQIINIDEDLCDGCGNCVPGCPEGALQIIDNKARLISDLFCDGLGACLGECPTGAIKIEEREAEPYDERRVMQNIVKQGSSTILAHLNHLEEHGETEFLKTALAVLKEKNIPVPDKFQTNNKPAHRGGPHGCPGSMARDIPESTVAQDADTAGTLSSQLRQWPVQLHLVNPHAPYFNNADLLVAADCAPFAHADFHRQLLKGKKLVILCPKLDSGMDEYLDKLTEMFSSQNIKSVTVVHMEVPCCFGAARLVQEAVRNSGRDIPVEVSIVSVSGDLIESGVAR